jgi:carboxypeptidase C (cathepsin A)
MHMPEKEEKNSEEKHVETKAEGKEEKPAPKDQLVVTQHKVRIGGKEIKYTATAGTMVLKEEPADREKEWEGRSHGRKSFLWRIQKMTTARNLRGKHPQPISVRSLFPSTADRDRHPSGCI